MVEKGGRRWMQMVEEEVDSGLWMEKLPYFLNTLKWIAL